MALEVNRENGLILVSLRHGRGWGFAFLFTGAAFALVGSLAGIFSEHLPHLSVALTVLWAFLIGFAFLGLGAALTKNGHDFSFSSRGLRTDSFQWRFISWSIDYPAEWLESIRIELQQDYPVYRVVVVVKDRPSVEITKNLRSEEAWQLASVVAEPGGLPIREA